MKMRRKSILAFLSVPLIAIGLAACGGGGSSSSTTATAASASGSGSTVSTMSISGVGTVLTDSNGNALYTNNQDTGSKIACTTACAAIWPPLAAPSSGKPTSSDAAVQAKLGVVKRSDGTSQVTYSGKPLYTFASDSSGQATGNGVTDHFGGTSFMWTAATVSGASSATSSTAASGSGSSGGGGGGYGY